MEALHALAWPLARLGEALEAVARHRGLPLRQAETPTPPEGLGRDGGAELGPWLETAAAWLGLEAEPVEASYVDVPRLVRHAGPALLRLPGVDTPRFLVLLRGTRHTVTLLGPDLAVYRRPLEAVCAALCQDLETPQQAEVERLLEEIGVAGRRRVRVRAALLRQRLRTARLADCWLLRLPAGTPFGRQLRHARALQRLLAFVGVYALQYGLWLLSWALLGQGALQERLDRGWLLAWALLLLTLVPLRMLVTWWQGTLAIGAGGLLKRRLLAGVLRLAPEEMRHQGVGQLLGGVIEAEAVEALALNGGALGVMAAIELGMAVVLFGVVPGGGPLILLLLGWGALTGLIGWRYLRQRQHWTAARLGLTHDLVERMVGHRTRLAQEAPAHWHDGEDQAVARYLELARVVDRSTAVLLTLVPRGWMVLGVFGVAPAFLTGAAGPAALAVHVGGALLAAAAFKKLATGLWQLSGAVIAWQQGERSRLYIARTLLQGAPCLILDESFAALDPETLRQALQCVLERAPTLLVIAHPDLPPPGGRGIHALSEPLRACPATYAQPGTCPTSGGDVGVSPTACTRKWGWVPPGSAT